MKAMSHAIKALVLCNFQGSLQESFSGYLSSKSLFLWFLLWASLGFLHTCLSNAVSGKQSSYCIIPNLLALDPSTMILTHHWKPVHSYWAKLTITGLFIYTIGVPKMQVTGWIQPGTLKHPFQLLWDLCFMLGLIQDMQCTWCPLQPVWDSHGTHRH